MIIIVTDLRKMTLKLAWPFQKNNYFRFPEMKAELALLLYVLFLYSMKKYFTYLL